ncbi:ER lumen protein retaining receptor [Spraguea lophii 42_110]|uniref:ER lumen protein-retaining receptor n=1 Tax=Spraguea lophii (strain 42_110) TaxID=1358809 RepID=S7W9N3_SPRLO|nr:ER lumen protein retaining receptor [Spraguea lophii 42_110]
MGFFSSFAFLIRMLGDISHVLSMIVLAQKIKNTKSCSGLSYKTQLLYGIVFISRYLDMMYFNIRSIFELYLFIMKVSFIVFQLIIIYLIRFKFYYSWDPMLDNFNITYIVGPALVLSFIFKPESSGVVGYFIEYLWAFSIVLEAVAILPQLLQLQETGESETLTSRYIFLLGIYRFLYVVGWILKFLGGAKVNQLLVASGIIQTLLYADFFIIYYNHIFSRQGKSKNIPKSFTN